MGHYLGTHCTACGHRSRVYERLHPQEYDALWTGVPIPCLKCWEGAPEVSVMERHAGRKGLATPRPTP